MVNSVRAQNECDWISEKGWWKLCVGEGGSKVANQVSPLGHENGALS